MRYSSDFFYFGNKGDFKITEEDIIKINSLKSYRSNVTPYYSTMIQWRLKDNLDVVKDESELSRLFICMQFISMTAIIKDKTNKYNSSLLRRLYLELYDSDCISMGYKRPFGNSSVLLDVLEVIEDVSGIKQDYDKDDFSEEESVLIDFVTFLEDFYKNGFELKRHSFVYKDISRALDSSSAYDESSEYWNHIGNIHNHLVYWRYDISEIRNDLIDEILNG